MKHMKKYFPDVNESTFYSTLRRLHADGSAEVRLRQESLGPTRKYYKTTESERVILHEVMKCWERIRCSVEAIGINTNPLQQQ